jgi:hypothetical protein
MFTGLQIKKGCKTLFQAIADTGYSKSINNSLLRLYGVCKKGVDNLECYGKWAIFSKAT